MDLISSSQYQISNTPLEIIITAEKNRISKKKPLYSKYERKINTMALKKMIEEGLQFIFSDDLFSKIRIRFDKNSTINRAAYLPYLSRIPRQHSNRAQSLHRMAEIFEKLLV